MCPLPLYHVGGLAILFRCLEAGATMVVPDPSWSITEAVRRLHPTVVSMVPTQLRRCLEDSDADFSRLRRVLMGGAPLPDTLQKAALVRGIPLAWSYGMTETASQIAATRPGQPVEAAGALLPHAEVRIGEDQEILVRGPSVAMGEWSEEGIRPLVDENGWLHTRDRGRFEGEMIRVDGRLDRMFISGGENIQPEAIEAALLSLEGVTAAVVVPLPDAEFGERPAAWVQGGWGEASVETWISGLRECLPGYMIPVHFEPWEPGQGLKPDREALRREMATRYRK